VKVVAISDMHGVLPEVPACDLLLLAGDITPVEDHGLEFQARWLDEEFRRWLEAVPARKVIGVAGNHDFLFEQAPEAVPRDLPWTYLQDAGMEWEGLKVYGTPWQPWFYDWAFNLEEDDLAKKWALIPAGTDVLVLHGPPYGYGDGVPSSRGGVESVRRCGSPSLLRRIEEVKPRLAVYGHIHPGAGVYRLQGTTLANVSLLDDNYQAVNGPSIFLLDADKRRTVVEAAAGLAPGVRQEVLWGS
jgi:Icc-related predicted phosphoesterase